MKGLSLKTINQPEGKLALESKKPKEVGAFYFLNKDIQLFGSGINDKIKESFYLEMSLLLSAGIDIKNAFDIVLKEKRKLNVHEVFENIKSNVIKGASFSNAMETSGKFSEYEYFSIRIGEETGKLPQILQDISGYYTKKIKQRRQIVSALTYPAIVTSFAVVAIVFMLNFVVPMFADVFKRFGGELPGITKFILKLSLAAKSGAVYFLIALIALIILVITQRNKPWFRRWSGKLLLRIPIIGKLMHKIYLSRFCNAMHLMIASKVTMLRSIVLVRQMIRFYPIEDTLYQVEQDILKGKPLNESMAVFSVYPHKMIALIKAGEEVNKLDFFFEKLYEQYTEETEHQSAIIGSLLEPLIIIFLGVLVGVILIAMYLPLFQLGQNF